LDFAVLPMSEHEQYADDLALYALDALTGEDRVRIAQHVATCASCRAELERLRGDAALLALSATGPRPPQRSRQRLMDALAREAQAQTVRTGLSKATGRAWWGWIGWAVAVVAVVLAFSLWMKVSYLREDLKSLNSLTAEEVRDNEKLTRILLTIMDPHAQRVTLVSGKAAAQPQGKAFYFAKQKSLVFMASDMPTLAPQKAYELWLIPMSGNPVPAGTFKPDAHGSATMVNPSFSAGVQAKAFAITVENETGSATPTMPIVMMGAGE
jgi:anti-sigma-K factor RskA